MSSLWRIELFGKLRAECGQRSIRSFRTHKTGALLAYLAFYRERPHPREALIELLWPERELPSGRHNLRLALSSLRHQLEPPGVPEGSVLQANRSTVQLSCAAVTTDVAEFESLLTRAAQAPNRTDRIALLARIAALYEGSLLPGYYESWILPQQLRIEDEYAGAVLELLRLLEEAEEFTQAIRYGDQAVTIDPAREELHLALMRLYARAGQPARALQQYRRLERLLQEQWGEGPSAPARQLARTLQERLEDDPLPETPTARPAASAPPRLAPGLAAGTVTFLLTGLAEARSSAEQDRQANQETPASPHDLARPLFTQFGGQVIKETGEGFRVAFPRADSALACAVAAQQAFCRQTGPETVGASRTRMALHTGDVAAAPDDGRDAVIRHAGQLLAAAHGGQILCSEATAALLGRSLPPGIHLTGLGAYRLPEEPGPERLFQVEYPEMTERRFPPVKAPAADTGCLPQPATRFFGKEGELARLQQSLLSRETRLLTLTGPGGSGKTRLALEAAARLEDAFRGAVWFVPLADLTETSLLLSAIQQALGATGLSEGDPLEQIAALLSGRPALLVLDNFEHLVEGGAPVARRLLERLPGLTCLITSRLRLALAGEREFPVSPLRTPEMSAPPEQLMRVESVQLFADRAQAVRPDFRVTRSNAQAVAELCVRLEGIPLALELAAARIQVLSPAQMLGQLARRLDCFISRQRDAAARHRTLRAAMDLSYRLLPPELQRFFTRLSVFRGGWTAEAAEAVCAAGAPEGAGPGHGQALDYLAQLQDHSLIRSEEQGREVRFRMLETIREYAAEKLAESQDADEPCEQHGTFFLALAEKAVSHLRGPQQARWLERLETEHDNLRAALARSADSERELRLSVALYPFWHIRGHVSEGRGVMERALRQNAATPRSLRAGALHGAGVLAWHQNDYAAARSFFLKSLELRQKIGEKRDIAATCNNLGLVASALGDYAEARRLHEQCLILRRETDHRWGIATSLTNLGLAAHKQGDVETARACLEESLVVQREVEDKRLRAATLTQLGHVALLEMDYAAARAFQQESLELCRELGDTLGLAYALNGLGNAAAGAGDHAAAREFHAQSLAASRELRDREGMAASLYNLGDAALAQGDLAAARACYAECLALDQDLSSLAGTAGAMSKQVGTAGCLRAFASLAAAQGQMERAARLLGAAEALHEAMEFSIPPEHREQYARNVARVQAALGERAFACARDAGRALTPEQAVSLALNGGTP
jgi:predicted ATPase/DNA-binding SARP family transcriptional activator